MTTPRNTIIGSSFVLKGQHVLIVDDTPTNLKVLSKTLTNAGIEVTVAINGEMAVQQVEYDPPELILLDVLMPGINGFETCRKLKSNPSTSNVPVIFMTALSEAVDKVKGLSIGAVDYITKPFEEEEVLARIKVHLQLRGLTKMLEKQNQELGQVVQQLKTVQQQMITQEKLATIGTLTAGVAHELRNPLNFVNNYAESSIEMSDELLEELENQAKNIDPNSLDYMKEILADLRQNSVTIQQNGQRAENVIQNMLMQARTDSVSPQLTDLNTLLDQAVKLAYKSRRGRGDDLRLSISTDYDKTIQRFKVIPSDLSRAFINLVDNACYALQQKQAQKRQSGEDFIAQLLIQTRNQSDAVEIRIRDNGPGISENIREKILLPFFTTKPSGEGTGLGLSITQDIIVGQHGGTLNVETEIGNYTEFIIRLPKS
ncbi:MAG: hybrid sensor histidine kinase/response regulator [Microcoleaceae cyanobacterium]